MKKTILVIFIILFTNLIADMNFIFPGSVSDLAMGGQNGIANLNHLYPNSVLGNPAKLGYSNGLSYSYSYTFNKEYTGNDGDMLYINSGLSLGYSGFGIILPMPSRNDWGNILEIGMVPYYEDNLKTNYESFGFGINLLQTLSRKQTNLKKFSKVFDTSIGLKFDHVFYEIPYDEGLIHNDHKWLYDAGFLLRFTPFALKQNIPLNLDIVSSMNWVNFNKPKFKSILEYQTYTSTATWRAYSDFQHGYTINADVQSDLINKSISLPVIWNIISSLFRYTYSWEKGDDYKSNGHEITVFDIFSYRFGYYDYKGLRNIDTSGWGIHLDYKDLFSVEWNHADLDLETFDPFPKKLDEFNLNVDLYSFYQILF